MRAQVSTHPTRALILEAIDVFQDGCDLTERQFQESRERQIAQFQERAWFGKSRERAERCAFKYIVGDYYCRPLYYEAFRNQRAQAKNLLAKWDCAELRCEAAVITLEDADLVLLSTTLDDSKAWIFSEGKN